jgi:transposase
MGQTITVLGIDIGELGFHVGGMEDSGHVVLRQRRAGSTWLTFVAKVPPRRLGMEACGSAQYWARCVRAQGHDVRLLAPQLITASVKSLQHAARDAEALCAAVTRPTRRLVSSTRMEPQALQALQRLRERRINARTALVHASRGLLSAYGSVRPQSIATWRVLSVEKLEEDQAPLTALSTEGFWHLYPDCLGAPGAPPRVSRRDHRINVRRLGRDRRHA